MTDRRLESKRRTRSGNKNEPMFVFQHVFAGVSLTETDEDGNCKVLSAKERIEGLNLEDLEQGNHPSLKDLSDDELNVIIDTVKQTGTFDNKKVYRVSESLHLEVKGKWAVCGTCEGSGKHVNPSIDRRGISREEFLEDPEFEEEYFGGMYDVVCYECGGRNVVPAILDDNGEFFPGLEYLAPLLKEEEDAEMDDYNDRRTRWYEDGCPRDYGPEDY